VFDRSVRGEIRKGCARNERKERVIYRRGEVTRIDHWIVAGGAKLLTTLLPHLKSPTAGIKRISQIGCGLLLARSTRCRVSDVNAFTKRNLIVTLCRRPTGRQGITCGLQAEVGRLRHRIFVLCRKIPGHERGDREGNGGK